MVWGVWGEWGETQVSFWGDDGTLELGRDCGYTIRNVLNAP